MTTLTALTTAMRLANFSRGIAPNSITDVEYDDIAIALAGVQNVDTHEMTGDEARSRLADRLVEMLDAKAMMLDRHIDADDFPVMFASLVRSHDKLIGELAGAHNQPQLTVWEGSLPESNGKSNFTAILRRKDAVPFETNEHCIACSEYPGRVKYEADCVRYLIGELAERPDALDYDTDVHSDYVPRDHERFISFYDLRKLMGTTTIIGLPAALEERMKAK